MNKFSIDLWLWMKLTRNLTTHVYRSDNFPGEFIDCLTNEVYTSGDERIKSTATNPVLIHNSYDDFLGYMEKLVTN